MHANHGNEEVIAYLRGFIGTTSPTGAQLSVNVRHGACLALGLAAMATHNFGCCCN